MGYISRSSTKHIKHKADRRKQCKEGGDRASQLQSLLFRNTCENRSKILTQTFLDSSPGIVSGCGLNSRFWAINGQTTQSEWVQHRPKELRSKTTPTFFVSWMPAQPDLLPNVLHRIGSSNRGPVVEEELDLHLRSLGSVRTAVSSSEFPTFLTSSNAAEKVENASYGTFSTVSDLIMNCK